jgi:epimerase EvaD
VRGKRVFEVSHDRHRARCYVAHVKLRELTIPDAYEISTDVFPDDRGAFLNPFRADVLEDAIGHPFRVLQTNHSVSRRGVVRGVHFAQLPPGQAKYVYVPRGAALDIVVDIRIGSPTYGQHEVVRLDDRDFRAVYLAEGLGHCAVALEDDTVLSYLCSTGYDPDREKGVSPVDPALALPIPDGALLSPRDTAAPTLAEAAEAGLLPTYDDCRAFYAALR